MAKINVYVLVLPDVLMLDMIGPAEVFNFANRYSQDAFELHFIGPETKVDTGVGLSLNVAPLPNPTTLSGWLLVPGQEGLRLDFETQALQQTITWLNALHDISLIMSVCSGALLLGQTSMLAERCCTTHHSHLAELQMMVPSAKVLDNRLFVKDGHIYTSAGVTAGIDLALYLVEQQCGADCAAAIARNLVLFSRRGLKDPASSPWLQNRNHLHQGLHAVQDLIMSDPRRAWSARELGRVACCSERHLARLFKLHAKLSCKDYIFKLRLGLAYQLLQDKSLSIEQVALDVGFSDVRQFRRIWPRFYAQSLGQLRKE